MDLITSEVSFLHATKIVSLRPIVMPDLIKRDGVDVGAVGDSQYFIESRLIIVDPRVSVSCA